MIKLKLLLKETLFDDNTVHNMGFHIEGFEDLLSGKEMDLEDIFYWPPLEQKYPWLYRNNNITISAKRGLLLQGEAWARFVSLGGKEGTIFLDKSGIEDLLQSKSLERLQRFKYYILHEIGHAVQAYERDIVHNPKYIDMEDNKEELENDADIFAKSY
jgi:hypothetical protein